MKNIYIDKNALISKNFFNKAAAGRLDLAARAAGAHFIIVNFFSFYSNYA